MTIDFNDIARQYNDKRAAIDAIDHDELLAANNTKRAVERESRRTYDAAIEVAHQAMNAENEAARKVHAEVKERVTAKRTQATEELNAAFVKEIEGISEEQVKLMGFMLTSGWWDRFQSHCIDILTNMPLDDYTAMIRFGTDDRQWCSDFNAFLKDAVEAGALNINAYDLALSEFDRLLRGYVAYSSEQRQIRAAAEAMAKAMVEDAVKAALADKETSEGAAEVKDAETADA